MDLRSLGVGSGFSIVVLAGWTLAAGAFGNVVWLVAVGIGLAVAGVALFAFSVRGWSEAVQAASGPAGPPG